MWFTPRHCVCVRCACVLAYAGASAHGAPAPAALALPAAKMGRAGATNIQRPDTEYSQATTRPNTEFRPPPQSGNPEVQVLAAARPAAWEVAPHEQKLEANGEVFIPFRVAKTKVSEVENDMRTLRSKHMKIIEQVEGQYKVRAHVRVRVRVFACVFLCVRVSV